MAPHSPVSSLKSDLRGAALARRDALDPEARRDGALRIAETVMGIERLADAPLVGAFWPIRSEVDPRPLIERLFANPDVDYIHVHNARRGCYSGRVDRV